MTNSFFAKSVSVAFILATSALVGGMMPLSAGSAVSGATAAAVALPIAADPCADAEYPYIPAQCLRSADGSAVPEVRWITFETRVGDNESMLTARPVLAD